MPGGTVDGDAPESTDPISLARQVVEDAIKLARAELDVVGAELKRAIIQLAIAIAMIIVAFVFLLDWGDRGIGCTAVGARHPRRRMGALAGARWGSS